MTAPRLRGRPVAANGAETRKRILDVTMRCVAETGYARATIREIAREAGMTSASLYHYFPTKAALLRATFEQLGSVSVARVREAVDRSDGVVDQLLAVLDEGDRLIQEYPSAVAFDRAIRVESAAHLHLAEDSDSIFGALHAIVVEILRRAEQQGVLAPQVDAASAASAVFAVLRGLYDHAATATPDEHHATVQALRLLIRGALFRDAAVS